MGTATDAGHPTRGTSVTLRVARAAAARHRSAIELRRNEVVYRQVVDRANEGVWAIDAEARTTFVNTAMAAMLGRSAAEMLGTSLYDFMDDNGRFVVAGHLARRRDGVAERGCELRFRRRDGSELEATLSTSPLTDDDGAYVGALALVTDATDRLRQARRLTEANERFRVVFDSAPIGMALARLDGRLLEVNPALCALLDHALDDLLRLGLHELVAPGDATAVTSMLRTVAEGAPGPVELEVRVRHRGAGVGWVALSVATVNGPDGRPAHLVCHCQDITATRQARENLVHQALHDPLTGLPNRQLLGDRLASALSRRRRRDGPVGILFVDVDSFKEVNDTLGHEGGDHLLVAVADRLRGAVRPEDTVARLGGDEFVVLLTGLEDHGAAAAAAAVAARAKAAVASPFVYRGTEVRPSVSIGVAVAGRPTPTPEELLAAADGDMYADKQRRRARA